MGNPLDLLTVFTIAGPPVAVGVSFEEGSVSVTLDAGIGTTCAGELEVVA